MEERISLNVGDNDVDFPFSEACGSTDILRKKLQLATYCQDRTFEPEKVIWRLRFLSVPLAVHDPLAATNPPAAAKTCTKCAKYPSFDTLRDTSDKNTSEQNCTLLLTNPGDLESCNHYVAVSYCWQQPRNLPGNKTPPPKYTILDGNKKRRNRAPTNVIQRAIDFAISKGYRLIWIDQECIDQDDVQDKLLHVQAMHLIYRQACDVVAVINSVVSNQVQADILEYGHYCKISRVDRFSRLISLKSGMKTGNDLFSLTLQLAESLAGDFWYTRAWTYQEALLATRPVYLLIPCDSNLHAPSLKTAAGSQLAILDAELLCAFRSMYGFRMSMSHLVSVSPEFSSALEVLEDSIPGWKGPSVDVALDWHRLCALDAIRPLLRRGITDDFDLIAIVGNLCNYKIRLDINMVRKSGIGLSVAFFALALLNGDLSLVLALNHNTSCSITDPSKALPSASIRGVATMPLRFDIIKLGFEPIFVCRVRPPTLLSDGLLIRGILWHIEYVDLSTIRERYIQHQDSILRWKFPNNVVQEIINATCQFLKDKKETILVQAIENQTSQMAQDLVFRIMLHPFLRIGVPEDPTVSDCRLLPSTAYEYGRFIVNSKGETERRSPLSGADKITYLFTPYRVLVSSESQAQMPQFLLVWPIYSVRRTPTITHMFSQGWPRKMKADEGLFSGDVRKLLTSSSRSEKMYRLYCF